MKPSSALIPITGSLLPLFLTACNTQTARATKAGESTPPNILYIMTDQQSYCTISALASSLDNSPYGDMNYFHTPNLDRLVRDGYSFTHCYAANPVSGPSRFALLTGESPRAYGMTGNYSPSGENGRKLLEMVRTRSMGQLFKNAGYETVYAGKVHLPWAAGTGGKESIYNPPTAYGFDSILTLDDRDELARTCSGFISNRKSEQPLLMFVSFMNPHDICMSRLLFSDAVIEDFADNVREIGARRNQLAFRDIYKTMESALFDTDSLSALPANSAPSLNFPRIDKAKPAYDEDEKQRAHNWFYYRLVEQVDGMIGQVLDALYASPMKDNTIIVFTSDHGEMAGSHGFLGKNIPYEECQRVPFVFMGKGIRKGIVDALPVCNGWDLLPTILDLAGIEIPKELNGISLKNRMLTGKEVGRRALMMESFNTYGILMDGKYKYTKFDEPDPDYGNEALTLPREDPGETRNEASNPRYASLMAELRAALDKGMEQFKR